MSCFVITGIDQSAAFTKNDVNDRLMRGDAALHALVKAPRNQCAQMALQSDGSFFNLQTLNNGRVRSQTMFMNVFAGRVAKTSHSEVSVR